jgi:hypothetical protein
MSLQANMNISHHKRTAPIGIELSQEPWPTRQKNHPAAKDRMELTGSIPEPSKRTFLQWICQKLCCCCFSKPKIISNEITTPPMEISQTRTHIPIEWAGFTQETDGHFVIHAINRRNSDDEETPEYLYDRLNRMDFQMAWELIQQYEPPLSTAKKEELLKSLEEMQQSDPFLQPKILEPKDIPPELFSAISRQACLHIIYEKGKHLTSVKMGFTARKTVEIAIDICYLLQSLEKFHRETGLQLNQIRLSAPEILLIKAECIRWGVLYQYQENFMPDSVRSMKHPGFDEKESFLGQHKESSNEDLTPTITSIVTTSIEKDPSQDMLDEESDDRGEPERGFAFQFSKSLSVLDGLRNNAQDVD